MKKMILFIRDTQVLLGLGPMVLPVENDLLVELALAEQSFLFFVGGT